MKKCPNCHNFYNDRTVKCPDCQDLLENYESCIESETKPKLKSFVQKYMKVISIIVLIIVFLLGYGLKSCTGIKVSEYSDLKIQNEQLSTELDKIYTEYASYRSKMQPYEEQQSVDAKAFEEKLQKNIEEQSQKAIENANKSSETKNTSSGTVTDSEAETKRLMQLYLDDFKNEYPSVILKVEAYSDAVFNIWFSNDWYVLSEQEKEYLANNLYTSIKNRYVEVSGKSDGMMSLTLYDQNSKTLATSKLLGGIELK